MLAFGTCARVLTAATMRIILTSRDEPLTKAWHKYCGDLEFVTLHNGSILDLDCDAVVSPANSFGFMDGGIDMLYSQHFGWHVQARLQQTIRDDHGGELVVGCAEIVETDNPRLPYLIAAPTMRVPTILGDTLNPYLAARAVLRLVMFERFSRGANAGTPISQVVDSVAFPGLGTGVGRARPTLCARQVRAAIDDVLLGQCEFPESIQAAQSRNIWLYTDYLRDLGDE
jgi:O-acetyl-ADP-ribose deacetylase (regulator of RNase III)